MHNVEFLCYFTCGCELKADKEATMEIYLSKNKGSYNNEWNYVLPSLFAQKNQQQVIAESKQANYMFELIRG